jgi:hypothetical protein
MTISEHHRLGVSTITLGLFLAGVGYADPCLAQRFLPQCSATQPCVPMTLNANVQLTKLHPAVTQFQVTCFITDIKGSDLSNHEISSNSSWMPVVNRGYAGSVTVILNVPQYLFDLPVNRTLKARCDLDLMNSIYVRRVVASATQPETITDANWHVVAVGPTVAWTQDVTFPNVAP